MGLAESGPADEFLELEYEEVPVLLEICAELSLRRRVASCRLWLFLVRDEDTLLLETRSARRAVQSSCEKHRHVRVLFLLDNLALILLLTKGRTWSFPMLAVIRRIHGIAYHANRYLVFRWVLLEVNYSDRGSRFSDADYDPAKCLLNRLCVLQQQSMPAPLSVHHHVNT